MSLQARFKCRKRWCLPYGIWKLVPQIWRYITKRWTFWTLSNKYCGSSANNELQLSSLDVTNAWTNVSVSFWVRHFLILDKLRMRKKATLQIYWTWCSWFITSLNITPMFLADSVGTTLTSAILMSHIGGRGRCLACITKNSVLSRLSLSLLHAIHA